MASEGKITPDTLALDPRRSGLAGADSDVTELADLFSAPPPPPPAA